MLVSSVYHTPSVHQNQVTCLSSFRFLQVFRTEPNRAGLLEIYSQDIHLYIFLMVLVFWNFVRCSWSTKQTLNTFVFFNTFSSLHLKIKRVSVWNSSHSFSFFICTLLFCLSHLAKHLKRVPDIGILVSLHDTYSWILLSIATTTLLIYAKKMEGGAKKVCNHWETLSCMRSMCA